MSQRCVPGTNQAHSEKMRPSIPHMTPGYDASPVEDQGVAE